MSSSLNEGHFSPTPTSLRSLEVKTSQSHLDIDNEVIGEDWSSLPFLGVFSCPPSTTHFDLQTHTEDL